MSAFETGGAVGPTGATGDSGPATLVLIHDSTLGADAASFDVTSIPATYKHIHAILVGRSTHASNNKMVQLLLNNDSGANYDGEYVEYNNAGVVLGGRAGATFIETCHIPAASAPADVFSSFVLDIPNYAGTVAQKTTHCRGNLKTGTALGNQFIVLTDYSWRSTAAINRLTFAPELGNFKTGSRLTIYGLN